MEFLASVLEAVPGLTFVFAVAALLLLDNRSELSEAIRVFVVAWCLYRISKRMDWLFDLFYGPEPEAGTFLYGLRNAWYKLRRHLKSYETLKNRRADAMSALHHDEVEGLYTKAQQRVGSTKEWRKDIEPLIGVSKAARVFIVPFFLIGVGLDTPKEEHWGPLIASVTTSVARSPILAGFKEDFLRARARLEFLKEPAIPFGISLVALVLFAYLRWLHMTKLYDLAASGASAQGEPDGSAIGEWQQVPGHREPSI